MISDPGPDANPLLITCIDVDNDLELLAHFLAHYIGLGIRPDRFRVILNTCNRESEGLKRAVRVLDEFGIAAREPWLEPYTSAAMWQKRRMVQTREAAPNDWVISADIDELHEYPEPLGTFLNWCDLNGFDCIQGPFVDRLATSGRLVSVRRTPSLFEQFPIKAEVMWSLAGRGRHHDRGGTVKVMATRGRFLPSRGGHQLMRNTIGVRYLFGAPLAVFTPIEQPNFRFALPVRVHHFHWTQKLEARLRRRLETPGVSPAGLEYGKKQLAHVAKHNGIGQEGFAFAAEMPRQDWQKVVRRLRLWAPWYRAVAKVRAVGGRLVARIRHDAATALSGIRP